MNDTPAASLLLRHLLTWPRRRWFYFRRVAFVGVGGMILVWGVGIGMLADASAAGLYIFLTLSSTVLFAIAALSAYTSGLTLLREKTEHTLGLLFLTEITPLQQIFGRFLGSAFFMLVTALSMFPLFVLISSLGGVSVAQLSAAFLVVLGTIFLGCCLGLFCASWARSDKSLIGLVVCVTGLVFAGLPIGVYALISLWRTVPDAVGEVLSPFVAMTTLSRGVTFASSAGNFAFSVILGLPFLWIAHALLPRAVVTEDRPTLLSRIRRDVVRLRCFRYFAKAPVSRNPVVWKDLNFTYGGVRREWFISGLLTMPATAVTVALVSRAVGEDWATAFTAAAYGVAGAGALVFTLTAVIRAARAFNTEKTSRTMELLLLTSLTERNVVMGKLRAVLWSSSPWLFCAALGAYVAAGISWSYTGLVLAVGFTVHLAFTAFGFSCLALFLSLQFRTATVLGICFATFFVWNSIVKYFAAMIPMAIAMVAMTFLWKSADEDFILPLIAGAFTVASAGVDLLLAVMFLWFTHINFRGKALMPI